jgi:hypothetical protein
MKKRISKITTKKKVVKNEEVGEGENDGRITAGPIIACTATSQI